MNRIGAKLATLAVTAAAVLSLAAQETRPSAGFRTYVSPDASFQIDYPETWKTRENRADARVFFTAPPDNAADRFDENLNVGVQRRVDSTLTLAEFVEGSGERLRGRFDQFETLESRLSEAEGRAEHWHVFRGVAKKNQLSVRAWQRTVLTPTHVYTITFVSSESTSHRHAPEAAKMFESFMLLPPTEDPASRPSTTPAKVMTRVGLGGSGE